MKQSTGDESREKLDSLLIHVRDILLDLSHDALKTENEVKRQQADFIFTLAKEADDLRRKVREVANRVSSDYIDHESKKPSGAKAKKEDEATEQFRRRKGDYPKYLRRGNSLVKVGLRKDRKSEYKHIVPEHEYKRVVEKVVTTGRKEKEFATDDLLMDFDGSSYHIYIVLSLLRQKKVVEMVRRGTYKLGNKPVPSAVENIWKSLPEEAYE